MPEIQHKFYQKTKKEQRTYFLKVGGLLCFLLVLLILIIVLTKAYYLIILSFFILMLFAPFVDTPSLHKQGKLHYYSPLFLVETGQKNTLKIHGGTLFDYYYVIDRNLNGSARTQLIVHQYLKGLLHLIEAYEGKETKNIKIKATSYIINERTASKIGLKKVPKDQLQQFILILNYLPVTIAFSYAKGKLSFPNMSQIQSFEGNLEDLIQKKAWLEAFDRRLS